MRRLDRVSRIICPQMSLDRPSLGGEGTYLTFQSLSDAAARKLPTEGGFYGYHKLRMQP